MFKQVLSVYELRKYWEALDALQPGQSISVIPLCFLPQWYDLCSELSWHHYLLGGGYFSKKHHGFCGVYRLIGLTSAGDVNSPATLNRVCGQDKSGTLYIGHASSLQARLNEMRRRRPTHQAIRALRRIEALDFPEERLAVAMLFTGRNTRAVEACLIEAYMNTFGDTPPLNYSL